MNFHPSTILTKTTATYADAMTYADTGLVSTLFREADSERVKKRPFSTAFIRGGSFRFEYRNQLLTPQEESNRYIVWTDGTQTRTWWDVRPGIETHDTLGMALAGATGVSGGSAHNIPSLLMPSQISGACTTNLIKPRLLENDTLEAVNFFRIEGEQPYGENDTVLLWIDRKTYLIHRIDTSHTFPDFRTETTTIYHPRLNGTVEEAALKFNAPGIEPQQRGDLK